MRNLFTPFISAYRDLYNTQHLFIRLTEKWRKIETVITLLGLFLWTFRRPSKSMCPVEISKSTFDEIISGVPQGSIVGPIL